MKFDRSVRRVVSGLIVAAAMAVLATQNAGTAHAQAQAAPAAVGSMPAKLSDAEFWALTTEISEPGAYFRIADNFTSNENEIGQIYSQIRDRKLNGGVYLGVGPEQNFTYISAIKPVMAFVLDIRRQAAIQHLMFKAMFELSKDRGDFLSLLFAKPKPKDLDPMAPIQKIWEAFFQVSTDTAFAAKVHDRVVEHLTKTHKFALNTEEIGQLDWVMAAFVQYGPVITTNGGPNNGRGGGGANGRNFADLTGWSTDNTGNPRSFLATDEDFQVVKALHDKNLIVPATGDFGGPKALRGIASYLQSHGGRVTAFYLSNVEQYLFQDQKQTAFYDNVAQLPITDSSVFIRPYSMRANTAGLPLCPIGTFLKSAKEGKVYSWNAASACSG